MTEDYKLSKPLYVGPFPPREDMQVGIEEVKDPSVKLGWTCSLKTGWEVKIFTEDCIERMTDTEDGDIEAKNRIVESLPNLTELEDGKIVLVMSIIGWVSGNVRLRSDLFGAPHVESGGHIFPLSRAEDDRDCWVTVSQINKSVFGLLR